jgi:hypothetical protein
VAEEGRQDKGMCDVISCLLAVRWAGKPEDTAGEVLDQQVAGPFLDWATVCGGGLIFAARG